MIHPSTELRFVSCETGHGVVATERIPRGTILWAKDRLDREFTPDEIARVEAPCREVLRTYCFRNRLGHYVLCWDHGRFINHSFKPNCMSTAYNMELAIRDIELGEELTDDYGTLNIVEPFRATDEGTRRRVVYPDDLLRYHQVWDKKLAAAFRHVERVGQPLRELLAPGVWATCEQIARGERPMRSIRSLYCASG